MSRRQDDLAARLAGPLIQRAVESRDPFDLTKGRLALTLRRNEGRGRTAEEIAAHAGVSEADVLAVAARNGGDHA